jgi:hypothetical protein
LSSCDERVAHAPRARSAKEVGSVASCLVSYPQAPPSVRCLHKRSARLFRSVVSPTPHFYAPFRALPKPGCVSQPGQSRLSCRVVLTATKNPRKKESFVLC